MCACVCVCVRACVHVRMFVCKANRRLISLSSLVKAKGSLIRIYIYVYVYTYTYTYMHIRIRIRICICIYRRLISLSSLVKAKGSLNSELLFCLRKNTEKKEKERKKERDKCWLLPFLIIMVTFFFFGVQAIDGLLSFLPPNTYLLCPQKVAFLPPN